MRRPTTAITAGLLTLGMLATGIGTATASVPKYPTETLETPMTKVSAAGGQVVLVAVVARAQKCTLSSTPVLNGWARSFPCQNATLKRTAVIPVNTAGARNFVLWLTVSGEGKTLRRGETVHQAAYVAPAKPTTPPVTTPTAPPTSVTACTGACSFSFSQPTSSDAVSVAMNSVTEGVPCPDPGFCDATATQQVDAVNVTVCAGAAGDSYITSQIGNFSLALADGSQAGNDSVTFDGSVPTAFGNYGAVAPNQCVTGDIYFDAPVSVSWTSLNYSYTSANFATQVVYVWKP